MGNSACARAMIRIVAFLVFMPLTMAVATPAADAASALCRKLERQLARSSGTSAGKISNAIRRQEQELAKATSRARASGCTGIGRLFGGPECGRLNSTIRRMQANLANLRDRGGSGGDFERERILAAIDANECRNQLPREQLVRVEKRKNMRQALERDERELALREREEALRDRREREEEREEKVAARRLPPPVERERDREEARREKREEERGRAAERRRDSNDDSVDSLLNYAGDTYRTLCVRTCDGYYFPVSFSTTKQNFKRDQKACEQMCPGTQVSLFYHHAQDEESEDMVSVTGNKPYSALPTAFAYRTTGAAGSGACSCQATAMNGTTIPGAGVQTKAETAKLIPLPADGNIPLNTWRIDPLTDPETYANIRGGFSLDAQIRLLAGETGALAGNVSARPVRVVGPAFLPDPEGAIDLRAPAPTIVQ
jgi:hypothetical protein